ncbi:MAG: T9SS type A sorting domain-containing protein [Bacteroidota bacterium]|nr:T9SS type A sorting domain-containing protein [Bacteroidota bacterium]MDX5429726.1 T9SS type A sorting domain-containing protein [Bacteroidota bacterium]MDX5468507.1 T9SS type A sorting domain-containing protein [Bacteroidota bacterium]
MCSNTSDPFEAFVLGLADWAKEMEVKVYPNPSSGPFTIELTGAQIAELTLQVVDVTGKLLHEEALDLPAGSLKKSLDLNLIPGTYYVRLIGPEGEWRQPVVVH